MTTHYITWEYIFRLIRCPQPTENTAYRRYYTWNVSNGHASRFGWLSYGNSKGTYHVVFQAPFHMVSLFHPLQHPKYLCIRDTHEQHY